jgi:hypothetical protein
MTRRSISPVLCAALLAWITSARAAVIDCTEAAWENALTHCTSGETITFNCPAGTTIPITPTRYANRVLTCTNVTIDGEHKVTFDMTPPWWVADASFCTLANCGAPCTQASDSCLPTQGPTGTGSNQTNQWVIALRGTGQTLKNITYRYFMEGIHAEANNVTIDGVVGVDPGDDSFSNPPGGGSSGYHSGVVLQNSTFNRSNDKAVILYGGTPAGSTVFDVRVLNNTFTNCAQPLRVSQSSGRYDVQGNTFQQSSPPSSLYNVTGPRFGDDGDPSSVSAIIYWKGNTVRGTRRGLRMTGYSQLISGGGNTYTANGLRGLVIMDHARAIVQQDTFSGNGAIGSSSSEAGEGGLAVAGSAAADAGGGPGMSLDGATRSSIGGNSFLGNKSFADATLDVQNLTTTSLSAKNNWWGDQDPSNQVAGTVVFIPFLSGPPNASAPPTVDNVRRTDRH